MSYSNYKKVTVWSAKHRKNKGYTINRNNFNSDAELEQYIKELKQYHKDKNKRHRESEIDSRLEKVGMPQKPKENPSHYANIRFKEDINLKLDRNTGNSTIILGSSKRGKSTVLMYLYEKYYAHDKNFISTLFSINAHIDLYKNHKNLLKCNTFNDKAETYVQMEKYINSKTDNKYKFVNMFDDIIDQKYNKLINEMVLTYRNSNLSTLMCLQYVYLASKMIRANVNNILIFGFNNYAVELDAVKSYLKPYFVRMGLKTEEEQIDFFHHVTNNHGFFYLHPASDTISFHRLNI